MKRNCKCGICKRGRDIEKVASGRSVRSMRRLIRQLHEHLFEAEEELDLERYSASKREEIGA